MKSRLFSLPSSPETFTEGALTSDVTCKLEVGIFTNDETGYLWRSSLLAYIGGIVDDLDKDI
jgi:hypothetical protein